MTVKELKEKLEQFDDNLIVMIPDKGWCPELCAFKCIPAKSVSQGINESDCCLFIDDCEEDQNESYYYL